MNKKLLIFLTILVMGFISVQATAIHSPNATDKWETGSTKKISWTRTAGYNGNMKIRLFNEAGVRILSITDSTANNGSFHWNIPKKLRPGKYIVRVRALNNDHSDDSSPFSIVKPKVTDVAVTDILVKLYKGKCAVYVEFKNNGDEKILINLLTELSVNGKFMDPIYVNMGNIKSGDSYQFLLFYLEDSNIKRVKVLIDTRDALKETNERNNSLEKIVSCISQPQLFKNN